MIESETIKGLTQLGFTKGWVLTNGEITLWENDEPQPTSQAIANAAKQYAESEKTKIETQLESKAAAEAKLAALGLTADDLKALGLA